MEAILVYFCAWCEDVFQFHWFTFNVIFWRKTQKEIFFFFFFFFVSSKTYSASVWIIITFMHFLKGLNDDNMRKNKTFLQIDFSLSHTTYNLDRALGEFSDMASKQK